ncbi:cob(I)yrinic acid a,c-diamide adenosyltransferase [Roseospirillum parvum]|uniref:Corrinoid adenosyltransferase n=1 Tax=Roseospirillum parvum TaxID=83401 RepID=A0A1G7Z7I3_9PROT|nr:cob(I)yrinic acid a,c-diamide adenosyltransferase [Roseospirillum parvum]SDH04703.1 cob(I)alamin adenosyltransferase [Roseospirillum parvum]
MTQEDHNPPDSDRHQEKMARKKAARDRLMASKEGDKPLLIVTTGTGKGKTTAALGMIVRCLGHGMKVGVVQFIKGAWDTAERRFFEALPGDLITFHALGEGFSWETQDQARDTAAAERAWTAAKEMLADPAFAMIVLDEINVAIRNGQLDEQVVIDAIAHRPHRQHVVMTGRGASERLIEAADLVTEMKLLKHPFRGGVKGQPGVEF